MATYEELADLPSTGEQWTDLVNKVAVAVAKKAESIASGTPTAQQKAWALEALTEPRVMAQKVIWYVLAANSGASTTQILGAADSAIQTNVDTAVDKLFV